jgi:hypothetical protein
MPAYNMAGPRSSTLEAGEAFRYSAPVANPNLGHTVIMSPFSGPTNSPLDAKVYPTNVFPATFASKVNDPLNTSTGALSTGIGYGLDVKTPGILTNQLGQPVTFPGIQSGYDDDETPGVTKPDNTAATVATLLAIGGGKSVITAGPGTDWSRGTSSPVPYVAQPLLAFGNAGSRDAGAGPAFTGFGMKMVTSVADVAAAAAIETGFTNRQGQILKSGNSQFGSSTTASAAVT